MGMRKPLSIAVGVALALPVYAQSPNALEEVIVTARKRMEAVQSIPVSVSVFTGEDLNRMGVTEFRDLMMNNPNVKINSGGAGEAVSLNVAIRGNLQNDTQVQLDPAVGTYVDGFIVAHTFAVQGTLVDVENVQTLKGPQGTLFGRNTTGGAILVETIDPDVGGGVSGYLKAGAGELGTVEYAGALNLPIGDAIALRLVMDHQERDGYQKQVNGAKWGARESDTARGKLLWNISDATSLLLSAERTKIDATSTVQLATQPNSYEYDDLPLTLPGTSTPYLLTDEVNRAEAETYNLTLTHDVDWAELKFLAGRRNLDVWINQSLPPRAGSTVQEKPDNKQNSYELQVNGTAFDSRLDWTAGLYYFDEKIHEEQTTSGNFRNMDGEITSASIYTQGTYVVTDAFNITVGLRFTDDERELIGQYDGVPLSYDNAEKEFNYLLTFDYAITDNVMAYASTSTGYRSGSAQVGIDTNNPGQWQPIGSESVKNYELGLKSDLLDGSLRINGAIFYQDYSDYQYTTITLNPGIVRGVINTDAVIQGGEVEITAALPGRVTVSASYGYVNAEEDASGAVLPNIPENQYSLAISKLVAIGPGDLEFNATYFWQDSFYTQFGFERGSNVDDVGLLNVSATYSTDQWSFTGYVNNATDEEYYKTLTYLEPVPGLVLINFAPLGTPRIAGVSVKYSF